LSLEDIYGPIVVISACDINLWYGYLLLSPLSVQATLLLSLLVLASLEDIEMLVMMAIK
jgi:hypothetical protein